MNDASNASNNKKPKENQRKLYNKNGHIEELMI